MIKRFGPARHKYNARPVVIDNIRFDSTAEGARYSELKLLQRAGEISGLVVHPRYALEVNGVSICTYVGDFAYCSKAGNLVLEDVKGIRLSEFRIKKQLMLACYGIEILETSAKRRR